MVLVAGRLEGSLATGAFGRLRARPAAEELNGHGPTRPLEMPSGMLLAPLGLAMRSAGDTYPEVNLLSEAGGSRIPPALLSAARAMGSGAASAATSAARMFRLRRPPLQLAEGGQRELHVYGTYGNLGGKRAR